MSANIPIESLKARLARRATAIEVGDATVRRELGGSWFGFVNVALPDEGWPQEQAGPLLPVAQLDLRDAPYVPPSLGDIELITVFFGRGVLDSTPNGDGWVLRAYPHAGLLRPIEAPAAATRAISEMIANERPIRRMPLRYRLIDHDYPDWDDAVNIAEIPDELWDDWEKHFGAASGCKLGGWPTLIQSEISWAPYNEHPANPEYVLQLDMVPEANFVFREESVCYFGRGTGDARDVWTLEWQCY